MNFSRYLLTTGWLALVLAAVFCISPALATTPPTPPYSIPWSTSEGYRSDLRQQRQLEYTPRRDLDNYISAFECACAFLDQMQEHDEDSDDFGGLHEGEGDRNDTPVEGC